MLSQKGLTGPWLTLVAAFAELADHEQPALAVQALESSGSTDCAAQVMLRSAQPMSETQVMRRR